MKRNCIIFLTLIIISVTALGFSGVFNGNGTVRATTENTQYLRIHVRAHSNEAEAQAVKYKVRDNIVEYLTPFVANYSTQKEAQDGIERKLDEIARVARETLQKYGYDYGASAKIQRESFPTRVYEEYTLPAGEYTALIVELGEGKGDNWWCVVYPPLCFTATKGKNVIYKSKILEIIERWKTER